MTEDDISVHHSLIHLIKFPLKPKAFKVLNMYDPDTRSKAFS